jgi:lysophospholipase L1-like esterase
VAPRLQAAPRLRPITTFILILLLQFGIFEIGLRTWGSSEAAPSFQGLFTNDPATGYRLKAGAHVRYATSEFDTQITINSSGVRDDEEIGPKPANERRIVILGDSLVLAVQVRFDQTFGERLEARLNAAPSPYHWRVINAGVQGYGPVEEQLFFQQVAQTLQPDIVLTTLFVGNDAEEAAASEARLAGPDRPPADALREGTLTRLRRLVRRSMVLQIVRLRLVSATERFTNVLAPPEPPLQSYATRPAPRIAHGLDVTRRAVEAIAERATGIGARTAVALMPARFQVDAADYGRLREMVANTGGELDRDAASRRFDAALAGLPLPRIDLLPALRAEGPGPDLFFQQTVHLTPRGHDVVAAALERFLRDSGLIPR